ncbi:MAG: tRNA (cytidine(34)-2'-O)-methyltransferase [Rhodospirillaceae bacterium]
MPVPVEIALFEPDIPQNTGAVLRTAACLDVAAHVIGPCGFVFNDAKMRRAGMDYLENLRLTLHESWADFAAAPRGRLVLLTTKGAAPLTEVNFNPGDLFLFGRESAGVPDHVHDAADLRVRIPMAAGARSLNLAASAAMVLGQALTQLGTWPPHRTQEKTKPT